MRARLGAAALLVAATAMPGQAQDARTLGPGDDGVPIRSLMEGSVSPSGAPSEAIEGRDLTLQETDRPDRPALPSAIAFPPTTPFFQRPGVVNIDPSTLMEPDESEAEAGTASGEAGDQDPAPAGAADDEASADEAAGTDPADAEAADAAADDTEPAASPASERDVAYGAYQRGYFLTAMRVALERAEKGDAAAQTLLGLIYEDGNAVEKDLEAAADWYAIASEGGDTNASYRLGLLYLDGTGVDQDRERAAELFAEAAEAGNASAAYNLGLIELEERDTEAAARHLEAATEAGNADAAYALALLYTSGTGVVPDDVRATKLMGEAAAGGSVAAQVEYAIRVFKGVGIDKNEEAAAAWFDRAARAGNPIAMNRLARLLAVGRGVAPDPVEASKWHLIARSRGRSDVWLDSYLESQPKEVVDEAQARAVRWWGG
ncbi:tetratricopeptide repeat protein [Amorphus orientalis]|uniref:TPR repeat protein n=1 Tax=Amorphus orientalis TaxID=649198 RepID=A0AAE4AU43_9HYPH|nr:tetratricopeptide repeat protein [Amorphus orientalis]MDQ0316978.1 TPR repeat protein [Amorphus orientalis]